MRPTFRPQLVNGPFGDPALYVDCLFEKRGLLFDLGDLKALAPRKILRVSDVFVSHTHMDHFMGFDWFLRINLGRERLARLFGPPGFVEQVRCRLDAYTWNLVGNYPTDFTLVATEIWPEGTARSSTFRCQSGFKPEAQRSWTWVDGVLVDEPGFRVLAAFLDHRIPCLAFALEEKAHVNVWKNRLAELGLPVGAWLRELKQAVIRGEPDDLPFRVWWREGTRMHERTMALGELRSKILRIVPGQKIAFVTDAAYHPENARRIIKLARGADLLFIEAMFLNEDRELAASRYHLTAGQAGLLARLAQAQRVIPFHFSPRYAQSDHRLRQQVSQAFGEDRGADAA